MVTLSKEEKIQFINDITKNIKTTLINKIDDIPENWNGYELRQYIADITQEQVLYLKMNEERKKNYINDRLVKNL